MKHRIQTGAKCVRAVAAECIAVIKRIPIMEQQ
jgi:hypothetical protein